MIKTLVSFLLFFCLSSSLWAKLKEQTVEYSEGGTILEGYLAYDDTLQGRSPGVIVVHEWMGLNEYVKRRAREVAKLGYVALAADIYGKGVRAKTMEEAGVLATKYKTDRSLMRKRARAALDFLKKQPNVIPDRLAAIGYCFGGTTSLELARSGANLKGIVSFHGGLDTPHPQDAKFIQGRVLVLHGGDDPFVPAEEVARFQNEMRDAKVDWEFVAYGGAVHSFTNPESGRDPLKGFAYNAVADSRSFKAMKNFLSEVLE